MAIAPSWPNRVILPVMQQPQDGPNATLALSAAALLLVTLLACGRSSAWFTPRTSQRFGQVCEAAREFYPRDVEKIKLAHPVVIGSVSASGNRFVDHYDLAVDAAVTGAEYGGTHIILTDADYDVGTVALTPAMAHCIEQHRPYGSDIDCYINPPITVPTRTPNAWFLVIRIDPMYWDDLPKNLHCARS
jgi:hypothetical protein